MSLNGFMMFDEMLWPVMSSLVIQCWKNTAALIFHPLGRGDSELGNHDFRSELLSFKKCNFTFQFLLLASNAKNLNYRWFFPPVLHRWGFFPIPKIMNRFIPASSSSGAVWTLRDGVIVGTPNIIHSAKIQVYMNSHNVKIPTKQGD